MALPLAAARSAYLIEKTNPEWCELFAGRVGSGAGLLSATLVFWSVSLRFVILGLDPRTHAVTIRTATALQDWRSAALAYGWFWTAGALPRGYGMDPRVCAVRFAPAPP